MSRYNIKIEQTIKDTIDFIGLCSDTPIRPENKETLKIYLRLQFRLCEKLGERNQAAESIKEANT